MVYNKKSLLLLGSCLVYSGMLFAEDGVALSQISRTLLTGGTVLSKLMWAVCIVVGIALIAAAFTQFQIHRRNPKLVPLATPVLYLILGIAAIALPFLGQAKGFLSSGQQGVKGSAAAAPKRQQYYDPNDIDAPLN